MDDHRTLDKIDEELVRILRANGRRSAADIAGDLSMSSTAVSRRIARLERDGVILGYSARVNMAALGASIEAFVELRLIGNTQPAEIHGDLLEVAEVGAVFTTSGPYDALVWVTVRSVPHLTSVIGQLRSNRRVVDTRTHIVLQSHVKHPWLSKAS